ncbi:MAG TPA: Trm112 family protein [Syntrophales bacterium]
MGENKKEGKTAISRGLLNILACPKGKGGVYLNETEDGLICDKCKLFYEIKDDIQLC